MLIKRFLLRKQWFRFLSGVTSMCLSINLFAQSKADDEAVASEQQVSKSATEAVSLLAKDYAFNDFLFTGVYRVDILENKARFLSCRARADVSSKEIRRYKIKSLVVARSLVQNGGQTWFETVDRCFVRASSRYLRWASNGEDPSIRCHWRYEGCR